ncbi:MAG TPA: EF-hand domain-containing protein [Rhodanobacteraceae bacterium]|jgi:hypothetical protein|nr:EF-hand domain-containing protein [Rhodanobacteraceae bacterium]
MQILKPLLFTALVAGAGVCSVALAQNTAPAKAGTSSKHAAKPAFDSLDKNHDHELSRSEIPGTLRNLRLHFVTYDKDGNGKLSPEEYAAYGAEIVSDGLDKH